MKKTGVLADILEARPTFRVRGVTQDVTECECCGKTNLQKTVVLDSEETGIVYFGTHCAAAAVYGSRSRINSASMELAVSAVDYARTWLERHGRTAELLERAAACARLMGCRAMVQQELLYIDGTVV